MGLFDIHYIKEEAVLAGVCHIEEEAGLPNIHYIREEGGLPGVCCIAEEAGTRFRQYYANMVYRGILCIFVV